MFSIEKQRSEKYGKEHNECGRHRKRPNMCVCGICGKRRENGTVAMQVKE